MKKGRRGEGKVEREGGNQGRKEGRVNIFVLSLTFLFLYDSSLLPGISSFT